MANSWLTVARLQVRRGLASARPARSPTSPGVIRVCRRPSLGPPRASLYLRPRRPGGPICSTGAPTQGCATGRRAPALSSRSLHELKPSRLRGLSDGRWQGTWGGILLELLPLHTALAGMHVVTMLLRFVAPMARAVVGDLLLHAVPCPRLIGFHLRAPVGRSLWLHAGHSWYPPRATRSALAPLMARGCALGKANEASGLTGESRYTICRVNAHAENPPGPGAPLSHPPPAPSPPPPP